ncbi:MAG: AAA family ATPase [Symploca sp. SIO2B6]|nr:AAA family ATPase [Symploca sp. SIO2B6]
MKKILIFGNSGSGKSTLAKELSSSNNLAYLELDILAWQPTTPPKRMPLEVSGNKIEAFVNTHPNWVIEGCYADLLDFLASEATEIIFMNLPVEDCILNASNRPWEPHKYGSKIAQDEKLGMLIDWISQYGQRSGPCSQTAHEALYQGYMGKKTMYTSNIRKTE